MLRRAAIVALAISIGWVLLRLDAIVYVYRARSSWAIAQPRHIEVHTIRSPDFGVGRSNALLPHLNMFFSWCDGDCAAWLEQYVIIVEGKNAGMAIWPPYPVACGSATLAEAIGLVIDNCSGDASSALASAIATDGAFRSELFEQMASSGGGMSVNLEIAVSVASRPSWASAFFEAKETVRLASVLATSRAFGAASSARCIVLRRGSLTGLIFVAGAADPLRSQLRVWDADGCWHQLFEFVLAESRGPLAVDAAIDFFNELAVTGAGISTDADWLVVASDFVRAVELHRDEVGRR